ncbi:MAG: hypothetical protein A2725_00200 [Candidatus Magasanikbacteria bacterium RIFCSPHIGHO2_01_FULL_33_34]|uniref:CDP-diacylglycerol--glycerol-3-phosphate 3-phosphatidyltransferase n=1 Tax=Candidatus Magasanikbacteria bacterium RIFCSPHIGHO2_01_FULL_33_34 TaxID=1798671 RepID=A0A1F6LKZ3_9BACT|nr:MAG: hypothetical protein A2725_00200 [Candidatus Magasanikbacteria bacterium RIFCSPHIGHO2_01_FULL_33_34]OGH65782.1 MAG: hypothetical protein A3B83_02870 [Candidatus Magasanikbacteria bacterium RIFCSPHIGHO2_02_FULL_33_17]OGH75147.1 MAG: hypothetical protein A3A89_03465 [Candidatus Magasanikbacteria bacterium RIFCSPLOWO2_01_FULL_33_34]OGH81225.1 MAG: hypothetical protein A3F93_04165 [Candidatus Magasanikbacteria bacterium RIFCSPLOWO2_12_FULL_34_7]
MKIIQSYKIKHPDLFDYLEAHEVHPHDHLMARTFLRLIPKSVTPNKITLFRIFATPFVFFLILEGNYKVGGFVFLAVAFTDALDGSLARTRNMVTKFGMMFDPLADKLLIGTMVLLLVFEYFNPMLGLAILGLEIVFILLAFISTFKFKTVRMANVWGKIKMLLQVTAVCVTLLAIFFNSPGLLSLAAWIFGLAIGFAVVSLFAHGI